MILQPEPDRTGELHVGLVNEGGRREGLAGVALAPLPAGDLADLLVDRGVGLVEGTLVAAASALQ